MSGWLSALFNTLDPFCGPAGIFTWFGGTGLVSCGDSGWGGEIAFGGKVTIQSQEKLLRLAAGIYTTIFRGLPELLTLFIVYYGAQMLIQSVLAFFGYDGRVEINAFVAGMVALAVVFSSYSSEVLLSAFRAIPRGQYEAGDALGLRRGKTMLLIVLPQLIRIALPGLTNLWLILLKDTSYVSVIGLADIVRQTGVAARVSKEAFFFYFLACLLYLILAMISSYGLGFIERWAKRSEVSR